MDDDWTYDSTALVRRRWDFMKEGTFQAELARHIQSLVTGEHIEVPGALEYLVVVHQDYGDRKLWVSPDVWGAEDWGADVLVRSKLVEAIDA